MEGQRRFNYILECFGEHDRECSMGALMKRKELVQKSKSKVSSYVGIYRTKVSMWFASQGMSRVQGSKKARSKEFGMGDLSSTQEVWVSKFSISGAPSHLRCIEARGFLS